MEQKNQPPKNPAQQAGQNQPANQPGKQGQSAQHQPGKQGQPGSKNEDFPGKAPDVYSDKNKNSDRSERPEAARREGARQEDRSGNRQ